MTVPGWASSPYVIGTPTRNLAPVKFTAVFVSIAPSVFLTAAILTVFGLEALSRSSRIASSGSSSGSGPTPQISIVTVR